MRYSSKFDQSPDFDPADFIIARELKDWTKNTQVPSWLRAELLNNAASSVVKVSTMFIVRMISKWILLRGIELVSVFFSEDPLVFLPSRDNYCYNPPYLKPCVVHTKVRDTFLLEAGMLGAI
jgi:hypothetical protein